MSKPVLNEVQIRYMVNRFLSWKLPYDFNPDGGITFKQFYNSEQLYRNEPTGTNLFDAKQAEAMVQYMAEGLEDWSYPGTGSFDGVMAARWVVARHPDKWKQALGNATLLGWFVGQAMIYTGGKESSEVLEELSKIRERSQLFEETK